MPVYKYQKGNKTAWYVKYKNITKRGFETKSQAKQYEAKLQLDSESRSDGNKKRFHALSNEWLENSRINTSYGTYQKKRSVLSTYILPLVDDCFIGKITEKECNSFQQKVSQLNLSTTHKNYILSQYVSIFNYCQKYYKLKNNPASVIVKFKKTYEDSLRKKHQEMNVWDIETFNKFIVSIDNQKYKTFFILLYFTGLRLGEALALRWEDFTGTTISINKSVTPKTCKGSFEVKLPKNTSSIRTIELGQNIANILIEYKKNEMNIKGFSENWFIFGRITPFSRTNLERIKNRAIEQTGIRKIRIHDFRHSHASNLIADGINIVAVSRRLGHSDVNMTLKVYTHLIKKKEDEIISYLDKSSQNLLNQ